MDLQYSDLYKYKLFEIILDRDNDGINVVNKDGVIVYTNKVSADYANTTSEKMLEYTFQILS